MTIDELIVSLKSKLLQTSSLEVLCYYFVNKNQAGINQFDRTDYNGEVEQIVIKSFSDEYGDISELEKIQKRIDKKSYKGLNIYHYAGLFYQDKLNSTNLFSNLIKEYFETHSFRFKYLLAKIFNEFEDKLIVELQSKVETDDYFILLLRHLYLENQVNIPRTLAYFKSELNNLDVIDLLLLEDWQNIKSIGYNKLQEELFADIIRCAAEIQSKHKIQNNNEDQYNSLFQSLLNFTGKYTVLDQTQRGQSSNRRQYGELDIAIFTKNNLPLSILEAFVINSIESEYIKLHLKKLSENYDPNGLVSNYAVIYARNKSFTDLWDRYKNFVITIDFEHELFYTEVEDLSFKYSHFSGIKIGLTRHSNRGVIVQIYHIFMDMLFEI